MLYRFQIIFYCYYFEGWNWNLIYDFAGVEHRIDLCRCWGCFWFGFWSECPWVCSPWIILSIFFGYDFFFFFEFLGVFVINVEWTGGLSIISTILLMFLYGWLIFVMIFLLETCLCFDAWLHWWWFLTWMKLVPSLHDCPLICLCCWLLNVCFSWGFYFVFTAYCLGFTCAEELFLFSVCLGMH